MVTDSVQAHLSGQPLHCHLNLQPDLPCNAPLLRNIALNQFSYPNNKK